jgi:uncharacterized protein YjiS (DUF1127 family)
MATAIHPDHTDNAPRSESGGVSEPFLAHLWHQASGTMHVWRERSSTRHALAELDDAILRDIGMTRSDVLREANKPFWEA